MSAIINGTGNPAIKRIRRLRSRKERSESGLYLAEGIRIVAEALDLAAPIETAVVAPDLLTGEYGRLLAARLEASGIPVLTVTPEVFASISGKEGPQGIAAVLRQRWWTLDDLDPQAGICWVALDRPQDPGNVGTIMRTLDAAGAAGLILAGPSTDPYDPAAVRAAMGALFAHPIVRTDLPGLLAWSRRHGCALVGTSDRAEHSYRSVRYRTPTVLLMGSEREGLPAGAVAACDLMVRIPMAGRSDSLNLAVATGIMLYEIRAQRDQERSP